MMGCSSAASLQIPSVEPNGSGMAGLPRLSIVSARVVAPLLPEAADGVVCRWRDRQGRIGAYGYSAAGAHWMHLPDVATFRFADREEITAIATEPVEVERIRDAYRRNVLPFVLQVFGLEVIHASAVMTPRGVVAFCAHSETGKSTVAYGLHRRGHPLWADDTVVFYAHSGAANAIPVPFRVRLRPASWSHFSRDGHREALEAEELQCGRRPRPLAAVFALERVPHSDDAAIEVERLASGSALLAALAHAQSFDVEDPTRTRLLVNQYLTLVASVPVFRARFPTALERLTAVLDRIEEVIR